MVSESTQIFLEPGPPSAQAMEAVDADFAVLPQIIGFGGDGAPVSAVFAAGRRTSAA